MTIDQLKFIILQNRKQLSNLYVWKGILKSVKHQYDVEGAIEWEYEAHNNLKRASKHIAKLVTIQQALKFEVQCKLQRARESREINKQYELSK